MTIQPAVMICGHGSRSGAAVREFQAVARHFKQRLPDHEIESGFLEFAKPVIRDGLEALKVRGATEIICLPGMLFAAGHVKNDLPSEINSFAADNPQISVKFGRELAIDPKLLRASAERIESAEAAAGGAVDRAHTLLMVVGRGTNDSDANSNISKVARMLWEGMGFGWTEVCYSGVAHPRVDAGLKQAAKLGFQRIIVFPYFLFTGILVDRIYAQTDEVAALHPSIEFVKARYLNDHPLVIDAFIDRMQEVQEGANVMNCQLCKYREQILGFEADQGTAQVGHHHHVRGIGTDEDAHHHHHDHHHHHGVPANHHGDGTGIGDTVPKSTS